MKTETQNKPTCSECAYREVCSVRATIQAFLKRQAPISALRDLVRVKPSEN